MGRELRILELRKRMFSRLCLFTGLLTIPLLPSVTMKEVVPKGPAEVLFFITNDCPIANSYAPEIQRICGDYAAKGVSCMLVYSDPSIDAAAIRKHRADFGYNDTISAVSDGKHDLAR